MIFVFLALSAQYESWVLPLAIILIVPLAVLAALIGVFLRDMDNNVLTQIGLIGLAAKNAILFVEFARQAEEDWKSIVDAAVEASHLRLLRRRPLVRPSPKLQIVKQSEG
ncbi:multidrug efflux pump subunit AcrB [Rhizobium sp. BK399]|nr:multidrug efflux pump subunit AcrB [Rhizobium sp. BK181]MBB3544894.1 multidrug efflux pump subunit AcrB [Rhizobium sp. BK399]